MSHFANHPGTDHVVTQALAHEGDTSSTKRRFPTRNVFKEAAQSKLLETLAQKIADLEAEMTYIYEQVDYLHDLELTHNYILVQEVQPGGTTPRRPTAGGTNAWHKRDFNTISHDDEGIITLSAGTAAAPGVRGSTFTAPAGIYMVKCSVLGYQLGDNQLRIYDNTLGTAIAYGHVMAIAPAGSSTFETILVAEIELEQTTTLSIEQYPSNNGYFGYDPGAGWAGGIDMVWASAELIKIA